MVSSGLAHFKTSGIIVDGTYQILLYVIKLNKI